MLFLSSLNNLQYDAYIIFQEGIDYFDREHKIKICQFGVGGAVPLNHILPTFIFNISIDMLSSYKIKSIFEKHHGKL